MTSYQLANNRILKNTILMYVRMLISLLVSLYTTRVVIQALGALDYGIFNVVSGFVTMLAFVNGSMVASTRRYLTISIASDTIEQQRKVFSASFYIHLAIAILITLAVVTLGYWYIEHKMTIPSEQIVTAKWVLTFSLFSILSLCLTVPHNALVVANEKMGVFSIISLFDVFIKLVIAIVISLVSNDRLLLYAFLYNLTAVFVRILYIVYCHQKFNNVSYKFIWDLTLYKKMISFAAYNMFSIFSLSAYQQGINILLNLFFNPVVNAARGIAVQVQGLATLLASNFQQAVDPQITKNYATGDKSRMLSLIYKSTKISYILVFLITFPIIVETEFILKLWLGVVPTNTVRFVQLSLLIVLFEVITNPITTAVLATGQIKRYQITIGLFLLSIIAFAYVALKMGVSPVGVYVINLAMIFLLFIVKLLIATPLIELNLSDFCKSFIVPTVSFTILSVAIYAILYSIAGEMSIINVILAVLSALVAAYFCGLSKSEKVYIKKLITSNYANKG